MKLVWQQEEYGEEGAVLVVGEPWVGWDQPFPGVRTPERVPGGLGHVWVPNRCPFCKNVVWLVKLWDSAEVMVNKEKGPFACSSLVRVVLALPAQALPSSEITSGEGFGD